MTSVLLEKVAEHELHTHSSLVGGTRWRRTCISYDDGFQKQDEQSGHRKVPDSGYIRFHSI